MLPTIYSTESEPTPWTLKHYYNAACQYLKVEKWAEAACLFHYLCGVYPDFKPGKFKLATCQMQLGYWEGAEQNLQDMIQYDSADPNIICNLAIIYWQKKDYKTALIYFKFNLKHFPHHIETRQNLASFYLKFNRIKKAILQFQEILNLQPKMYEIRFNLAACLHQLGIYDEAIMQYRYILDAQHQHDASLYNLACIYYVLKNNKAARFFWEKYLKVHPHHQTTQYMLNHLEQRPISSTQHREYVKGLFDHYASFYNQHMALHLNYQLPAHLHQYLANHCASIQFASILELGCGTGLCAKTLSHYTPRLIGVDISEKMINKAKMTGLYQALHQGEAVDFLNSFQGLFELIVALDVIPYIMDLSALLKQICQKLRSKAHLLFSIEVSQHYPYELQGNGRFSHHPDFVNALSKELGLKLIHQEDIMARTEHEIPVIERFYHWEKP